MLAGPAWAQAAKPPAQPQAQPGPQAQAPQKLGAFTDWEAYTFTDGKNKICYLLGRPKSSEPKDARRGDAYVMVTHRAQPKSRGEFSVNFGYGLKPEAAVEANTGGEKFVLFGKDETAWTPDEKIDRALVDAMSRGQSMTVRGITARGTATTDNYSLRGFGAARKAIDAACPN
jgi:Invasion associated locus B (IalB) protein